MWCTVDRTDHRRRWGRGGSSSGQSLHLMRFLNVFTHTLCQGLLAGLVWLGLGYGKEDLNPLGVLTVRVTVRAPLLGCDGGLDVGYSSIPLHSTTTH